MIVAANWKMNLSGREAAELASAYLSDSGSGGAGDAGDAPQRILFAPHPYLVPISMRIMDSDVRLGGQDCHAQMAGPHTGDVSASMLADCGATVVLLGHSERRAAHNESDALVQQKAITALAAGLDVMICVGETADERKAGEAIAVIRRQLLGSLPPDCPTDRLMIAYEPVWAIGTGAVASIAEINEIHDEIRTVLTTQNHAKTPILYGGSVKPENAAQIFGQVNVGGALVGGASLDAGQFAAICAAARGC